MPPLDCFDKEDLFLPTNFNKPSETDRFEPPQAPETSSLQAPQFNNDLPLLDLRNCQVLEQRTAIALLHDPQTQMFHVYERPTQSLFCTTMHWPIAYRAWLSLSRRHVRKYASSPLENLSFQELQAWVNDNQDKAEFGQLLYSCDCSFRGLLQYSVRLSATVAMHWGPSTHPHFSLGQLTLEPISHRRHRPAKWIDSSVQTEIANALHRSLELFHHRWSFNLYQFNSEHWARLVATGHCCSFQRDDLLAYWEGQAKDPDCFSATQPPEIWDINPEAEALLKIVIAP